jgi:hypothetical protein
VALLKLVKLIEPDSPPFFSHITGAHPWFIFSATHSIPGGFNLQPEGRKKVKMAVANSVSEFRGRQRSVRSATIAFFFVEAGEVESSMDASRRKARC